MSEIKHWFGFKLKSGGKVIVCGPYSSNDEVKLEREKSKAWDCEVSVPFIASTKEEAEERVKFFLT